MSTQSSSPNQSSSEFSPMQMSQSQSQRSPKSVSSSARATGLGRKTLLGALMAGACTVAIGMIAPQQAMAAAVTCTPPGAPADGTYHPAAAETCAGAGDTIDFTGASGEALNDSALDLQSVTINNSSGDGIDLTATGAYNLSISDDPSSSGGSITASSIGIDLQSGGGNVAVTTNPASAGGTNITGGTTGLYAATSGNGTIALNLGTVVGQAGDGIDTLSADGDTNISSDGAVLGINGGDGIHAVATGAGAIAINIYGDVRSSGASAIDASTTTAAINITLNNTSFGAIVGDGSSPATATIKVGGATSGGVTITNNDFLFGNYDSSDTYVLATASMAAGSAGAVTINNNGVPSLSNTGTPPAIWGLVDLQGASAVTFNNASIWIVGGTNSFSSSGNNTLNNTSSIFIYNPANHVGDFWTTFNAAFDFGSGNDTLTNSGSIVSGTTSIGGVQFSPPGLGTYNVPVNTVFDFGAGDDTLVNTSTGIIDMTGTTLFDFGAGTNSATNAGTIRVNGTMTFANAGSFANSGLIDMHYRVPTPSTPGVGAGFVTTDMLTIGPGVFTGSGNSVIRIDLSLGAATQTACTAPTVSDCVALSGSAGVTHIDVRDTNGIFLQSPVNSQTAVNSGGIMNEDIYLEPNPGAYNPVGIVVVAGASAAANFDLAATSDYYSANPYGFGPVLDKPGAYFYDLAYDSADSTERLIGVPKPQLAALPSLSTGAQAIWYATSPLMNREPDPHATTTLGNAHFWGQGIGEWATRTEESAPLSIYDKTYDYNTSYTQSIYGVVGGLDVGRAGIFNRSDELIGGIMVGYVSSDQRFKATASQGKFDGDIIGLYLNYLNDGFYLNGKIKADLLTLDYSTVFAPSTFVAARLTARTTGAEANVGKRFDIGDNAFLEPLGSLAYTWTSIGGFTYADTDFRFTNAPSFRGSLGLRGSLVTRVGSGYGLSLSLTGRAWDEWDGNNKVAVYGAGPDLGFADNFSGAFGEVNGEVKLFDLNGDLSGFVSGDYKFKSGYKSSDAMVGLRYRM
jgi:hypothetical protein